MLYALGKLNAALFEALRAYESAGYPARPDGIVVALTFEGELAAIEALGFRPHAVNGNVARGTVRFRDIRTVERHPSVRRIAIGTEPSLYLDTAASDIKARASRSFDETPAPDDGLWHVSVDDRTGRLTHATDATGSGVIVALIDTGIDYTHPAFMRQLRPEKKSRIIRIWDQGLTPLSPDDGPHESLLDSSHTYGTEFVNGIDRRRGGAPKTQIDDALNGGLPLEHRDCDEHGTHVAAIAAGGTLVADVADASFVGIAPEADIIAVKAMDVPTPITYQLPSGPGEDVDYEQRIRDAVLYCLETAKDEGKPVVINMSFGNDRQAGDGIDDLTRWMDDRFDPDGVVEGGPNYPSGAIAVKAAGNSGDPRKRLSAIVTIPDTGEVTVPFVLKDTRDGLISTFATCARKWHRPAVGVHFWYRYVPGITFAVHVPGDTTGGVSNFRAAVAAGLMFHREFVPDYQTTPPTISWSPNPPEYMYYSQARLSHQDSGAITRRDGVIVYRNSATFELVPSKSDVYYPGTYEIRITGVPGTHIYVLCQGQRWASKKYVTFAIADRMDNGSPLPPESELEVTNRFSMPDPGGAHVITVASYDDVGVDGAAPHAISPMSSRGPLRDFSFPTVGPIAEKPDIAAPGVNINAAQSNDTDIKPGMFKLGRWRRGRRFLEKSGTSMAAPMITGVVALLLDKKPELNVTQVRELLKAAAREGMDPADEPARTDAYGGGMVDALETHGRVTT